MNILFSCVGRRTYLLKYFRQNLDSDDRIIAADMTYSAPALQVADYKVIVPSVYAPGYIDKLLAICEDYSINALISLNDLELPILANNAKRFEDKGVKVIVSGPEVIDICFDKLKTSNWVSSIGLCTPKTFISLEDAKAALKSNQVSFPLFLKPRWGSGSICLETVDDEEELDMCYSLLLKRIKKTILATASIGDEYILIQEKLTGPEYGLDVINDLWGNYVGVSVKQKLAMRSGETDKAITVDLPAVHRIGQIIGENLKHIGNLDVDIMQRANGDYCVLELNPRFGGGFPFSYEAGVNLPKAIVCWLKDKPVDSSVLSPMYGRMFAKNDYLMEIVNDA